MKRTTFNYFRKENFPEIFVAIFAFFSSTVMAWYVYVQHLTTTLADQAAHLVFSRLLTDSLTPGITQLGTWPPLLHILMMPATAFDPLFRSGLAGPVTLIPIFVFGVILLYRLAHELTKDALLSVSAALLYATNPYVLYYTVTPMMEVLFITMVIAVAYFFSLWIEYGRLRHMILAGMFITLASVSRYEGIFLIPVAGLIVIANLLFHRKRFSEIEATALVFGIPAVLGLAYLMVYDWIFAGHPLAFAGFEVSTGWDLAKYASTSVTKHSWMQSFQYLMHSSYYMLGKELSIISLISFACVLPWLYRKGSLVAALLILLAPFLVILLALYRGSSSIDVPDFGLSSGFHNERYALSWVGFSALAPILAIYFLQKVRASRIFLVGLLFVFSGHYTYATLVSDDLIPIRKNITTKDRSKIDGMAVKLDGAYDFGKILATRFNNDFLYLDGDVLLKDYIYEGNYKYFDQTLSNPWLYARWVITLDPKSSAARYVKDPIKDKWSGSEEFDHYYAAVGNDQGRVLYKINEDAVVDYANERRLDLKKVPSLNASIRDWNPDTVWREMQLP